MNRRIFSLVLCIAGMSHWPSALLYGQAPTPVIPTGESSPIAPALETNEKAIVVARLAEAQRFFRTGQFNKAIDSYNKIISTGAEDASADAGLARVYLKLKKPDLAYSAAAKAVELNPKLATAHSALGETYLREGKLPEAREEFATALRLDQMDARAYFGLSLLFQASFNFKKAKMAIDNAYKIEPFDPDIRKAWVRTRPRPDQIKELEDDIASDSSYYNRVEKAGFKQQLALMKDQTEHPERTCSLARRPDSAELPLRRIISNDRSYPGVGLDVRVNGQESRLLVGIDDLGITINQRLAEKAGVIPIVRADMNDLGDQNPPEGYIGFSRFIQIANLEFQNCYVFVVEKVSPDSAFDRVKGTIDAKVFSSYLVDLDIPDSKLKLHPLPPRPATEEENGATISDGDPDARRFHDRYVAPEMVSWEHVYRFGGQNIIPVRVNDSPPQLFDVSPKYSVTFIAPELARRSASMTKVDASQAYGINGKIEQVWRTGPVILHFDNLRYAAAGEDSVDLTVHSDKAGTEISGILGFDVLANLDTKIDFRDGLFQFNNGNKVE
jgi:tetratricopeptide (TPR) repeat protein